MQTRLIFYRCEALIVYFKLKKEVQHQQQLVEKKHIRSSDLLSQDFDDDYIFGECESTVGVHQKGGVMYISLLTQIYKLFSENFDDSLQLEDSEVRPAFAQVL